MKRYTFAATAAAILLSIGSAFAYHPIDRNVRGTLEQDQRDRIELEDVQRGSYRGTPSAAITRPAKPGRRGADSVPPYLTEHHTR